MSADENEESIVADLVEELLPVERASQTGARLVLRLIAYDVSNPKRLRRVAKACEDYGTRVQKSLFECWLEQARFEEMLGRINQLIDAEEDSVAAYTLDRGDSARRSGMGDKMNFTEKQQLFVF